MGKGAPKVRIDWECGEASLDLGERFRALPTTAQLDILDDLSADLEMAQIEALRESGDLAEIEMSRMEANQQRRDLCAKLQGARIEAAEPLPNGHVALRLADGTSLVFAAQPDGGVDIGEVPSIEDARTVATVKMRGATKFIDELLLAQSCH